jgi:hypothetical protein
MNNVKGSPMLIREGNINRILPKYTVLQFGEVGIEKAEVNPTFLKIKDILD